MSTVALPRWVVGLLVGLSVVCLVAVAFLLGRVTAHAPAAVTAPATVATADRTSPAAAGVPPDAPRAAYGGAPPSAEASGQEAVSGPPARVDTPTLSAPDAAAVAAYFSQMDAVAAEAKASQDPQTLARSVLDQTLSGNTGAIEGLIATQRSLELRLEQIQPPPSCREHHQRSVRLFGRAITLLERTRDALTGQGATDMGSVAAEGRAIEAEARAVDALANDIRRAAGLAPVP